MIIGYARTSTADQIAGFEAQIKELQSAGCEKIFQEKASSIAIRTQLQSAIEFVREGDFLVITKLDRLARSVSDLMIIIQDLENKKVGLRILNLGMDTRTPTGKLMLIEGMNWCRPFQLWECIELVKRCPHPSQKIPETRQDCETLMRNIRWLRQLKKHVPEEYTRLQNYMAISNCYQKFAMLASMECASDMRPSHWFIFTLRSAINGKKLHTLSQYVTWTSTYGKKDPLTYMKNYSKVILLHQDIFFIAPTMKKVASLFGRVMKLRNPFLQELQSRITEMQYPFAHAMPFDRGTAAAMEWMEMAIYRYYGYHVAYEEQSCFNLEALTLPLAEYVQRYPDCTTVTPITDNEQIKKTYKLDFEAQIARYQIDRDLLTYVMPIRQDNPREALRLVFRCIENNSSNTQAKVIRGSIYRDHARFPEALIDLDSVLRLEPKNCLALSVRWNVYFRLGELQKAADDLKTLISLQPDNQRAIEALQTIDN